jgi:hypothetical protein
LVNVDRPLGIHNSPCLFYRYHGPAIGRVPANSRESEKLPAGFAGLAGVTLIVIASSSASASKPLSTSAAWPIRFWFGLIDGQRTSTQFSAIQCRNGFIGFTRIGHFHKRKTPRAARLPVSHDADLFHVSVRLENGSQL